MQAALLCIKTSLKLYFQSLPLQLLRKKIHKSPDFRADCIVAVIDGVKRFGFVQGAVGQEFVQVSRSNIGGDGEIRQAMPLPSRHRRRMVSPLLADSCGTAA